MRAAALIPLVFFFVTSLVVAIRLLLLWRRTRELPEFAIGAGVVLLTVLGLPFAVAGRLSQTVGTTFGAVAFGIGLAFVCAGIMLFFLFTTRVFHAGARWARAAEIGLGVAMAAIATGVFHSGFQGGDVGEVLTRTRPWTVSVVGMLGASFGWSGIESLRCHAQLHRRRRLGLHDPVLENRFLLWGIGGLATATMAAAILGFLATGRVVLMEPVALFIMAATGLVMGSTWLLTFLPPAFYLRRLGGQPSDACDSSGLSGT